MNKCFLALCILFGSATFAAQITTQGTGEVQLVPDQVHFFLSVHSENDLADRAMDQADGLSNAIIEGFRQLGVADELMQTISFNIYQTHEYKDGNIVRTYYVAEHRLKITLIELSQIGRGFQIATGFERDTRGTIQVSIQLDSSQRDAARDQALAAAVENARKKATIMAEAEGLSLGPVIQMTNTFLAPLSNTNDTRATDFAANSVMPGQISISASATVVFGLVSDTPVEPK